MAGRVCTPATYCDALEELSGEVPGHRTLAIALRNGTGAPLRLVSAAFAAGAWFRPPPDAIPPGQVGVMSARNSGFLGGVAGAVVYAGPHVHALCAFENPVLGEYRSFMDAGGSRLLQEFPDIAEYGLSHLEPGGVFRTVGIGKERYRLTSYGGRQLTFIAEVAPPADAPPPPPPPPPDTGGDRSARGTVRDPRLYRVLDVPVDATPEDIRRAWRRGALRYHPDKHPDDPQADARFKELAAAYETLGDPDRRAAYDRSGSPAADGSATAEAAARRMLECLFGEGRFRDVFGDIHTVLELAIPTVAQERALRAVLWAKLQRFVDNEKAWAEEVQRDVDEKAQAPGGQGLLLSVGYIYGLEARRGDSRDCCLSRYVAGHRDGCRGCRKDCSAGCKACSLLCDYGRLDRDRQRAGGGGMTEEEMHARAAPLVEEHLRLLYQLGLRAVEHWCREICQGLVARLHGATGCRMLEGLARLGAIYTAAGRDGAIDVAAVLAALGHPTD